MFEYQSKCVFILFFKVCVRTLIECGHVYYEKSSSIEGKNTLMHQYLQSNNTQYTLKLVFRSLT